jgi:hypothetical protein
VRPRFGIWTAFQHFWSATCGGGPGPSKGLPVLSQHHRRARARVTGVKLLSCEGELRRERTRGTSALAKTPSPARWPWGLRPPGTASMSGCAAGVQTTCAAGWCGRTVDDIAVTAVRKGSTSAPGVTGASATALGAAARRRGEARWGRRGGATRRARGGAVSTPGAKPPTVGARGGRRRK